MEDKQVWKALFDHQSANFGYFSEEYLNCMHLLKMDKGELPNFDLINEFLQELTAWNVFGVPEIVGMEEFLDFMDNRRFPATTWVRSMKQLKYLEEPDMFHDGFGHIPLLANRDYANFLWELGQIGIKYAFHQIALDIVQKVYWFTIEFGLIRENGEVKAYGAGLISSEGELLNSRTNQSEKIDFDIELITDSSFRTDIFQVKYFVIDSFNQLYKSIGELEELLKNRVLVKV